MNFVDENTLFEIISGCKNHNSKAQHHLYEIYAKRMTALCYRYCNDYEAARDLMHDGFIRVFSHIEEYSGTGNFEGWLKKVFVNMALDKLRRTDALKEAANVLDLENFLYEKDPDFTEKIDISDIMQAISELPVMARTVFNMYNIDGYPLENIAKELNMTATAVRSQHARAKQKLQAVLRKRFL
ncbi:MAG: sigma-70 family RNA polymerase sigma factor [Prevotellaceae bacterium]|jgi:RNA polymerase sigma-70 factor (ECF subfamily)|nr:sigma-70 family RNA polymerase sigma factor [Prevotellaceae bacterium]